MKAKTHKKIAIGIVAATVFFGVVGIIGLVGLEGADGPFRRVAVVRVEGVVIDANWHVNVLREHLLNRNIAGVLLRIDSPGGAVAPSQELYNEVAAFREMGKPLVVSMGSVAASGGYYIASGAQRIFALPGTLTGSIGVIFTLPNYEELTKKIGVDMRVLTAGDLKDAGSPYRAMSARESEYLQSLLDNTYDQFIYDVARGRGIDVDVVRGFADGKIFTGHQALYSGMIDTLGGFIDALNYLHEITGVPESMKPVERRQTVGWREWFFESAQRYLPGVAETIGRPTGLYYLFLP